MGVATTRIRRTKIIDELDLYLANPKAQQWHDLNRTNPIPEELFKLGKTHDIVEEKSRDHVRDQFLGEDPSLAWWPDIKDKRQKLKLAYLDALNRSLGTMLDIERDENDVPPITPGEFGPRPIITVWNDCPSGEQRFDVCLYVAPRAIIVNWHTEGAVNGGPMKAVAPDLDGDPNNAHPQDFWLIAKSDEVAAEWAKFGNGTPDSPYNGKGGPRPLVSDAQGNATWSKLQVPCY